MPDVIFKIAVINGALSGLEDSLAVSDVVQPLSVVG
jgi:hypothetical protein